MRKLFVAFLVTVVIGTAALTGTGLYIRSKLRAYRLEQAAQALLEKKADIKITVPEGWRREQIAALLEVNDICSYDDFMVASASHEGKLFPDTYRFFAKTPAAEVVETMVDNFAARTEGLGVTDTVLGLAAIVEREAVTDVERPQIAGVYSNRLKIGMRMEADPTVQYGKDTLALANRANKATFEFWKPILRADYQNVKSPYNTYLITGLPPTPIANPGLASIKAALNPTQHNYYYFLHRGGQVLFSRTLEEHVSKQ